MFIRFYIFGGYCVVWCWYLICGYWVMCSIFWVCCWYGKVGGGEGFYDGFGC